MKDPTINFPKSFWTTERLGEFWSYVKYFIVYNMPFFMICMAVFVVSMVITMIVDIPLKAKQETERADREDDVEVKYY